MMVTHWARRFVVLAFICASSFGSMSVAASPHLSPPVISGGEQDQDDMLPPGNVPPAAPSGDGTTDQDQDQDGMLPGEQTPDDDGDGVADADDSAPNNPNEGKAPAPGPTDPIADSDNDGLPNVMDPDDNNNGVPDADEGVGTVDEVTPVTPVPTIDSPAAPVRQASAPPSEEPLVFALPSTGSGTGLGAPTLPLLMAGVTLLLAASGLSLRSRRS